MSVKRYVFSGKNITQYSCEEVDVPHDVRAVLDNRFDVLAIWSFRLRDVECSKKRGYDNKHLDEQVIN